MGTQLWRKIEIMPPGIYPGNHRRGSLSNKWKGGRNVTANGYIEITIESHPRRNQRGYIFEHIVVTERILGKFLPPGAVVHHVDENKQNNFPSNLVICQNETYHQLIHQRKRALRESGHPHYKWCGLCKKWDDPTNMVVHKHGKKSDTAEHRECINKYQRLLLQKQKEKIENENN